MLKIFKILVAISALLVFKLRIYPTWSKVYRWLYHGQYADSESAKWSPLRTGLSPIQAQNLMNLVRWAPDGKREFWDAIGSPHWFQYALNKVQAGEKQPRGAMDCDEFAIWAANVVDEEFAPRIASVVWVNRFQTAGGKTRYRIKGHNVCIVQDRRAGSILYFHIGNWGRSRNFISLEALFADVAKRGGAGENFLASWAVWTPELRHVRSTIWA